ncbi:MAG: hypothetical protein NC828_03000 [Candidatus Omnitrophica bacterium]|nr:hypothetical protein [Candidatus Omnitrophota bacterium]
MRKFIIIYDIPRDRKALLVKINRALHAINAEKIQHSVWQSSDIDQLKIIAGLIKQEGGVARILEEKEIV